MPCAHRLLVWIVPLVLSEACAPSAEDLAARSGADAAQRLASVPSDQRFPTAFSYGEASARREGLVAVAARGALLPEALQHDFFDGAAHGWSAPDDLDPAALRSLVEASLPWQWRHLFDEATARSWTELAAGEPDLVVPRVEAWRAATGGELPLDGVRVGLQRSRGGDLPGAVAVAGRYPLAWQGALYEELGWRAGVEWGWWSWRWAGLLEGVPPAERCAFVHGVARGQVLRQPWRDADQANGAVEAAERLAAGCEVAAWQGVAWGLHLTWGPEADAVVAWVRRPAVRAAIARGIGRARSPQRPPPWQMPG